MLESLYQQILLDHSRHPCHHGRPERFDAEAEGHNPICGDKVRVFVTLNDDGIEEVRFEGAGCAISQASASMMTNALSGLSIEEATAVRAAFLDLVAAAEPDKSSGERVNEELRSMSEVRRFPARVKCATLAWHALARALDEALNGSGGPPSGSVGGGKTG
ncbi:MAG: SUF system NifU family Fe-S cluster assembly protein [Phycisphaerales bacterium]|nr:MAG: SUF system NifU family Fe-S cluster assembly protein [Phycisphaerales bacterium]